MFFFQIDCFNIIIDKLNINKIILLKKTCNKFNNYIKKNIKVNNLIIIFKKHLFK